jgi:cryptochrome
MLDERAEKDRCLAKIKNAYQLNLHGDSPEVLDGSAPDILRKIHEETGAAETKSKEQREEKKRVEKRKKSGDGNLDGFVKKVKA